MQISKFKIFLINLKSREENWTRAHRVFSLLSKGVGNHLERIEAVDTRKGLGVLGELGLSVDPVGISYQLYFSQSAGAAGCYASHYSAWKKIVEEDLDYGIILEDDIVISDVINFLFSSPQMAEGVELLHLGRRGFEGLEAYLLNKSGAEKLISLTHDHSPLSEVTPRTGTEGKDLEKLIIQNPEFDWSKKDTISAPVDRFVMHATHKLVPDDHRVKLQFMPCVDLTVCGGEQSDIYGAKMSEMTQYYKMNKGELEEFIQSKKFKSWEQNTQLTLCICTYNNYRLLYKSLIAAINQNVGVNQYDIIVLDNTPEEIIEELSELDAKILKDLRALCWVRPNAQYVYKETDGLSGARNECIELCSTELIHFIDDDAIADRDLVKNMISKFTNPNVGVVGGRIDPCWSEAARPDWLSDDQLGNLSVADFSDEDIILQETNSPVWLVGANICFRTDLLKEVGGFNTALGRKGRTKTLLSGEEDEVIRVIAKDHLAIYTPHAKVEHIIQPDRLNQSWFVKRCAWQAASDLLLNYSWRSDVSGVKDLIHENYDLIFSDAKNEKEFSTRMKLITYLTHYLLNGDL
jgi:GR25 family glycosyltransferase involved in LPS biosynthesis/glycosyltransferase involved in cell wall biosynthesis